MLAFMASAPDWLQAVILGLVQGATEFVPVSSSGHLVITPYLFGWERPGLAFDVALHVGTAGAILVYFRRELWLMGRATVSPGFAPEGLVYRRLALLLAVATVPVAVVGVVFRDLFEEAFEEPQLAAVALLLTAAVLLGGEKLRERRIARVRATVPATAQERREGALPVGLDANDPDGTTFETLTLRQSVMVGVGQAMALIPGLSRSGTTITAGLAAGLTRPAATRFSFLLALPALIGAAVVSLPELSEPGIYSGGAIAGGVVAAFVAGYAAIAYLVRLVSQRGLGIFAAYVVVVSAGTLVFSLFQ